MGAAGIERERRFLVRSTEWRGQGTATSIVQGYLSTDRARVVRVRAAGEHAWLTVKGTADEAGARSEIECEIPLETARAILGQPQLCIGSIIEKTRTVVRAADLTWEIDEFGGRNAGLRIAEVEHDGTVAVEEWNARVDAARPGWIGAEITGRNAFANSALTERPFDEWPAAERVAIEEGRLAR